MKKLFFILFLCTLFSHNALAEQNLTIGELMGRSFLDDYQSNVVFGYNIIMETKKYAPTYTGNQLACRSCHLNGGTLKDALPLNVLGMYPKWRSKNGKHNGIGLRIRECFLYSMNGFMPPENAPEVLAVAAYVSFLSKGEIIGEEPDGRSVPTLETTGFDPNQSAGQVVYKTKCAMCHGDNGEGRRIEGIQISPPVWGLESYNSGAGMNRIRTTAGFIWANMPYGQGKTLSIQEALDVSAYLNIQVRGSDPRKGKLLKLVEPIGKWFGL